MQIRHYTGIFRETLAPPKDVLARAKGKITIDILFTKWSEISGKSIDFCQIR